MKSKIPIPLSREDTFRTDWSRLSVGQVLRGSGLSWSGRGPEGGNSPRAVRGLGSLPADPGGAGQALAAGTALAVRVGAVREPVAVVVLLVVAALVGLAWVRFTGEASRGY
jgi:hypothetical protein